MKKIYLSKYLIVLMCLFGVVSMSKSQQINTQFFIENSPLRHQFNPAFQPLSDTYIGIPILGYLQSGVTNNSLSLQDFIYNNNGQTVTFLHPTGNVDNFYNALRSTTLFNGDLRINLLHFGFRISDVSYWHFSLSERVDAGIGVPKDMFKLLLYGTPDIDNYNQFNLNTLDADATLYTEIALGYSRKLNDEWTVGAKAKLLLGTANVSIQNNDLNLNAGINDWHIKGNGVARISSPLKVFIKDDLNDMSFGEIDNIGSAITPSGIGMGVDLGFTYSPIEPLTISLGLIDLGLIRWSKNPKSASYEVDYTFSGLGNLNGVSIEKLADSIGNAFMNATPTNVDSTSYTTYTTPKLNAGVEYMFLEGKLGVGLLSKTMLYNNSFYEELTASVSARPVDWFNVSLGYSILNGNFGSIGAAVGLRTGPLHWLISTDFVATEYAKYNAVPIPYKTKGMNFGVGLNIVLGNGKDSDKDGVKDKKDLCPDTPLGVKVDKSGCPIDTDGDGVPDYLDKCPDTPVEARGMVDADGCPMDSDGDGVPDYLDKCPDTPAEARGMVDENGCPIDSDGDGVPDYLDKCPHTPKDVIVDENGCPIDSDGDGVPDYLDKCPKTPKEAIGMVDENGCPIDTDGDGVPDYLDKCPNTPKDVPVDANGCPKDSDGDGVPDYLDKCPGTPAEAYGFVDENGCPLDSDGDGIPDYLDKCPKIPGVASNNGCPEVKKEVRQLFQKALRGIQFDVNKATIKPVSFPILDEIVKVMNDNPTYKINIKGHTDSSGNPESNLILSKNRANSVSDYLIKKGVSPLRLTAEGFGDTLPVASNKTAKGKALNRRVEFIVEFEEISYE